MQSPVRTLALTVAMAGAIAAPAATAGTPPQVVQIATGQGLLSATGTGVAIIDGDAAAIGVVRGPAVIVVEDRAGDAKLRVAGRLIRPQRARPAAPFLTVRRFRLASGQRRFLLSGTDMRVRFQSGDLAISASGNMRVRLRGQGSYTVDNGAPQAWVAKIQISVGAQPTASRPAVRASR